LNLRSCRKGIGLDSRLLFRDNRRTRRTRTGRRCIGIGRGSQGSGRRTSPCGRWIEDILEESHHWVSSAATPRNRQLLLYLRLNDSFGLLIVLSPGVWSQSWAEHIKIVKRYFGCWLVGVRACTFSIRGESKLTTHYDDVFSMSFRWTWATSYIWSVSFECLNQDLCCWPFETVTSL